MTVPSIAAHRTWYEVYNDLRSSHSDDCWDVHDVKYSDQTPPLDFSSMYKMRITHTITTYLTPKEIAAIVNSPSYTDHEAMLNHYRPLFGEYALHAMSSYMAAQMRSKVANGSLPFFVEVRAIGIADVSNIKFAGASYSTIHNDASTTTYVEYTDRYLVHTRLYTNTPDGPMWSGNSRVNSCISNVAEGYTRSHVADNNRKSIIFPVQNAKYIEGHPFKLGDIVKDNTLNESALFIRDHQFFSSLIGNNQ